METIHSDRPTLNANIQTHASARTSFRTGRKKQHALLVDNSSFHAAFYSSVASFTAVDIPNLRFALKNNTTTH